MNTLTKPVQIKYLAVEKTSEIDVIIQARFARLKQVYSQIQDCQVKVANIARHKKTEFKYSYLVSINLTLLEGVNLYTLRCPRRLKEDSLKRAIADAFAMIYRKLIELQLE